MCYQSKATPLSPIKEVFLSLREVVRDPGTSRLITVIKLMMILNFMKQGPDIIQTNHDNEDIMASEDLRAHNWHKLKVDFLDNKVGYVPATRFICLFVCFFF